MFELESAPSLLDIPHKNEPLRCSSPTLLPAGYLPHLQHLPGSLNQPVTLEPPYPASPLEPSMTPSPSCQLLPCRLSLDTFI